MRKKPLGARVPPALQVTLRTKAVDSASGVSLYSRTEPEGQIRRRYHGSQTVLQEKNTESL